MGCGLTLQPPLSSLPSLKMFSLFTLAVAIFPLVVLLPIFALVLYIIRRDLPATEDLESGPTPADSVDTPVTQRTTLFTFALRPLHLVRKHSSAPLLPVVSDGTPVLPPTSTGLRPLVLSQKYSPLAGLEKIQPSSASPITTSTVLATLSVQSAPTTPVIVVSTSTSLHTLASVERMQPFVKKMVYLVSSSLRSRS
jgi:hypothetical protein